MDTGKATPAQCTEIQYNGPATTNIIFLKLGIEPLWYQLMYGKLSSTEEHICNLVYLFDQAVPNLNHASACV